MREKRANVVSHVCILLSSSAQVFKMVRLWKDHSEAKGRMGHLP